MLSRSGRGHFTSAAAPPTHHHLTGAMGLHDTRRSNTALEKLGTFLLIAVFPIQLLDTFKPHLLSTLHLNKIFLLLAYSREKAKQHYHYKRLCHTMEAV